MGHYASEMGVEHDTRNPCQCSGLHGTKQCKVHQDGESFYYLQQVKTWHGKFWLCGKCLKTCLNEP